MATEDIVNFAVIAVLAERSRCIKAIEKQLNANGEQDNAPLLNALTEIRIGITTEPPKPQDHLAKKAEVASND